MTTLIYTIIDIPYLSTGRCLYALSRCLELARASGDDAVAALIEEAIAHGRETAGRERSWDRSKNVSTARGEAATLDNQIDGVIGAMYTSLKNNTAGLESDNPVAVASQTIIEKTFPEGVRPIIQLPFEDQLILNSDIVTQLTGALSAEAAAAGIAPFVTRLEGLNARFGTELTNAKSKEIDFAVVEAARDRLNLFIRRVAAVILGTHHQETDAAAEARRTLLKPILDQGERVRQARKGRRPPADVNPNTGEELPPEEDESDS